jgi:F-type H+-transporting ATPase subunit epsilon
MANTMHIDIVSAEAELFSGKATMFFATGILGELGIAPGHTQLLTQLRPGNVRVQFEDGTEQIFYVSGGLLEVQPSMVTVLSDTAVRAADLDESAALEAKRRAEQAMSERTGEQEYATARAELAEAMAQLQTISKLRKMAQR